MPSAISTALVAIKATTNTCSKIYSYLWLNLIVAYVQSVVVLAFNIVFFFEQPHAMRERARCRTIWSLWLSVNFSGFIEMLIKR